MYITDMCTYKLGLGLGLIRNKGIYHMENIQGSCSVIPYKTPANISLCQIMGRVRLYYSSLTPNCLSWWGEFSGASMVG